MDEVRALEEERRRTIKAIDEKLAVARAKARQICDHRWKSADRHTLYLECHICGGAKQNPDYDCPGN